MMDQAQASPAGPGEAVDRGRASGAGPQPRHHTATDEGAAR